MEIQKLNPFGYQAKTENGNTYKKTNTATAAGLVTAAAIDTAGLIWKDNKLINTLSCNTALLDATKTIFKNLPKSLEKPLIALGILLDIGFAVGIGRFLDNRTNKVRAAKADHKAELNA